MSQSPFESESQNPYEASKYAGDASIWKGAPPGTEPVVPLSSITLQSLEYWESVEYQFRSPNWLTNILWGFLALLSSSVIPFVGQAIFLGYQCRLVDVLIRTNGRGFIDFNWDDLEDYCVRGLWSLLACLLTMMCCVPVLVLLNICITIAMVPLVSNMNPNHTNEMPVGVGILLGLAIFATYVGVLLSVLLIASPIMMRAGLGRDFGRAFDFQWIFDFARKMWPQVFLSTLFLALLNIMLLPLGLMMCFVGAWATMVVAQFSGSHFWYQWYVLYLNRGGEPIYLTLTRPRPSANQVSPPKPIDPPQPMA